jgi:beta-glucanase (GH16 family)
MKLRTEILLAFIAAAIIAFLAIRSQLVAAEAGVLEGGTVRTDEDVQSGGWQLVWRDEFDSESLDRTKWQPEESCWGGGNDERQCYVDREENIQVEEGVLRLIALEGAHEGPLYPEGIAGAPGGTVEQEYTSGKLRTRGLATFKYGRFSARIKLPAGQGTWSAFWMMPEGNVYGDWPLSGEFDIMEAVNLETACAECPSGIERRTSGALHFGEQAPDNQYLFARSDGAADIGPSGEWHEYALEWAEGTIQWFIDGRIFLRLDSDQWFTGSELAAGRAFAPFDQPFHIALNLAVGGNLAEKSNGMGFDPASFPAEMQVDWVRVEQCENDPETGKACLSDQAWTGTPSGPWEVQAR